tara:strand:+ start:2005 stop:2616 length:612 start_codon:yes stop_codon:yes gene_type:complete
MEIIECTQGEDEWLQTRLGKVTASRFKDVISKGRGNAPSKTREAYMLQLVAELLTDQPQDNFTNAAMEWGTETEPQARATYEFASGLDVVEVGFITHSEHIGVSPDGLIGDNGLLEIKCPKTTTHLQRVRGGVFPTEYKAQVQGQLWVSEREWCDFVSFDPRIVGPSSYFCIRVNRDEDYIKELESKVNQFVGEMLTIYEELK